MLRIALIDDEPVVLDGMRYILNRYQGKYEIVGTENNGEDGLHLIEAQKPDIVISDIKMPGFNGLELLKRTRAIIPDIYFVILTGYAEFQYAKEAIHYGATEFFLKPVEYNELLNTLDKIDGQIEKSKVTKSVQQSSGKIELLNCLLGKYTSALPKFDNKMLQIAIMREIDSDVRKSEISDEASAIVHKYEDLGVILDTVMFNGEWIIALDGRLSNPELEGLIISLENAIQKRVIVGLSNQYKDLESLKKAYKEAREAVDLLTFNNKVGLLPFEDIPKSLICYDPTNEKEHASKISQEIIENTVGGKVESLKRNLALLSANMDSVDKLYNPGYFTQKCEELLIYINKLLIEKSIDIEKRQEGGTDYKSRIESLDNYKEVFAYTKDMLVGISQFVDKEKTDLPKSVRIVLNYIEMHYFESITLKTAAEMVFLNPWYFSELFKLKVGISFSDYLLNFRIDKAKVLLKQRDLKIFQISEMTGFNDSAYFCNIFKKITGTTPGDYRKIN